MVLTIHHLQRSQSERIVWLCEELHLDYTLKTYPRSPRLAPPELKSLHPAETAPVITDDNDGNIPTITLAESGAVVEYILSRYDHEGSLRLPVDDGDYPDYLYWLHFGNGSLQPNITRILFMNFAQVPSDNPAMQNAHGRREHALKQLDNRLASNVWLAGNVFTAADIMNVVCVTTMRLFVPFGLEKYPNVVGWLERVGRREGYRRAMGKGDPGLEPVMGVEAPMGIL